MEAWSRRILEAIDVLFRMVDDEPGDEEADRDALADALDRLVALGRHAPSPESDEDREAPRMDTAPLRDTIATRFPMLGEYNTPENVTFAIGETQCLVGNAVDDLAELIGDLDEVRWHFRNSEEGSAMWEFRFSYDNSWGRNAANLRWFLEALRLEL